MASKPKILIFIDWFLPGYKAGGPIQSCANVVEHLKEDFDFWVITRDTDYCETEPYTSVTTDTWNKLEPHLQVFYSSSANLNYSKLTKAAREVQPDIVFINGIYSFYFSILPLRIAKKLGCRTIVSVRGMLAPSAIQVKGGKKKLFLKAVQLLGLYKGVCFHATNEAERGHIKQLLSDKQEIRIAPNLPKPVSAVLQQRINKNPGELKLVTIARIAPEKNTLYALQLLAQLNHEIIVTLDLYGPIYDKAYWQECQAQIDTLPANVQVTYCGSIENELVHDAIQQYHVMLMPTRGENFGHIILESLSAGLPVLISDQTPWRNLKEKQIGFDIPLTDPAQFIEAFYTLAFLDSVAFEKMSVASFNFARNYMQDVTAVEQNKKLFQF